MADRAVELDADGRDVLWSWTRGWFLVPVEATDTPSNQDGGTTAYMVMTMKRHLDTTIPR